MKSLTEDELDLLVADVRALVGARLQKVLFSGNHTFALECYHRGDTWWWIVDLNPRCPLMFLSSQKEISPSKKVAPLQLFLKAHFSGKHLLKVERSENLGRVVQVEFTGGARWELHLYPHGQNFLAFSETKSISFHKPRKEPLPPRAANLNLPPPRSVEEILETWRQSRKRRPKAKSQDKGLTLAEWRAKRERLIKNLQAELERLHLGVWQAAGETLKTNPEAQFSSTVERALQNLKTPVEKMEFCFRREKKLKDKKILLEQRIQELTEELQNPPSPESLQARPAVPKRAEENLRFKTFHYASWTLWVGRSGSDNLTLLRGAKPWYLWMHLRDEPGAHGVVRRNRNETIPPNELRTIVEQFAKLALSQSEYARRRGTRAEVVLAEVRYLRPVKGDRHGRVHYSRSETINISLR